MTAIPYYLLDSRDSWSWNNFMREYAKSPNAQPLINLTFTGNWSGSRDTGNWSGSRDESYYFNNCVLSNLEGRKFNEIQLEDSFVIDSVFERNRITKFNEIFRVLGASKESLFYNNIFMDLEVEIDGVGICFIKNTFNEITFELRGESDISFNDNHITRCDFSSFAFLNSVTMNISNSSARNNSFENFRLEDSVFENVDMRYSYFSNIKFIDTEFKNVDLRNSTFKNCNLEYVKFDRQTKWPGAIRSKYKGSGGSWG